LSPTAKRYLPVSAAAAGFLVFAAATPVLDRGHAQAAERFDATCEHDAERSQTTPLIITGFATGSAAIPSAMEREILAYAGEMRHAPKVCVIGQADKRGSSIYNDKLAMKRARAVAARLINAGLDPAVISLSSRAEAFGDRAPSWLWLDGSRRVVVIGMR